MVATIMFGKNVDFHVTILFSLQCLLQKNHRYDCYRAFTEYPIKTEGLAVSKGRLGPIVTEILKKTKF